MKGLSQTCSISRMYTRKFVCCRQLAYEMPLLRKIVNTKHTNNWNNGVNALFWELSSKSLPIMSSKKTIVARQNRYLSKRSSSV